MPCVRDKLASAVKKSGIRRDQRSDIMTPAVNVMTHHSANSAGTVGNGKPGGAGRHV